MIVCHNTIVYVVLLSDECRLVCDSECDVIGPTAATSSGASGCLSRGDVRAPAVREVHRVTFAEDRNKYLNADDPLCDGLDFELEVLGLAGQQRTSDDDDAELIPRHSIIKLPRPPRYTYRPKLHLLRFVVHLLYTTSPQQVESRQQIHIKLYKKYALISKTLAQV